MDELLAFLLTSWGIVGAWTLLSIGKPLTLLCKKISPLLGKLVSCPGCLGFWVGALVAIFAINPASGLIVQSFTSREYAIVASTFACGLMSSGFCLLMHTIVQHLYLGTQIYNVQLAPFTQEQKFEPKARMDQLVEK